MSEKAEPVLVVRSVLVVEDDGAHEAEAMAAVAVFGDVTVKIARTVAEAEQLRRRHRFDLAVVDLGLPDGSGTQIIERLTADGTLCVARTVFLDDDHLFPALAAGAGGYLLKAEPVDRLRDRLMAAARGEPVLSPAIARRVLAAFQRNRAGTDALVGTPDRAHEDGEVAAGELTAREREILRQAAQGLTVREIALALDLSANTVKSHVRSVYAKLGVRTRVEAVDAARRLGIAEAPHPFG